MRTLRLVLGDQLSRSSSTLRDVKRTRDTVLMVEVQDEATYVRHHQQKQKSLKRTKEKLETTEKSRYRKNKLLSSITTSYVTSNRIQTVRFLAKTWNL